MTYDVIIIGTGPAGLSAAIYAQRAQLNTLVIEKQPMSGGQVLSTYEVDNYPGLQGVGGFELGMKFREHADVMGAKVVVGTVLQVINEGDVKKVVTNEAEYFSKTIIIATGANHKKLQVQGENELVGMGVSYCATCDGAFFKNRTVAVIGGGNVALEDALFLGRVCKKVYLIHRRDTFRGAKILQNKVINSENIEIIWDTKVVNINGKDQVESITVENVRIKEQKDIEVQGVFVAVGIAPNTTEFVKTVEMDAAGYVVAGEDCITNVPGIYAAGDLRTKALRQIITAAADGANAITSVENYLIHG